MAKIHKAVVEEFKNGTDGCPAFVALCLKMGKTSHHCPANDYSFYGDSDNDPPPIDRCLVYLDEVCDGAHVHA